MKKTLATLVFASTCLAASVARAQSTAPSIDTPVVHPMWSGVWQGNLDGVPAVTLTLAEDTGEVNGTIVFHLVEKENGHAFSASTEPHTLMQPHIQGYTIAFQVRRGDGSAEILNMTADLKKDGSMHFACSNCGSEGTKAELERMR